MSHGIETVRDFVLANSADKDWHKLTRQQIGLDPAKHFPQFEEHKTFFVTDTGDYARTGESVLISKDDGQICGKSFRPESFGYILPQTAWDMIQEALAGTGYTVERIGMLWNRSFWFASVSLDELREVSRKGEAFQLNFSGALDGEESPQGELSSIRAVCWNTISLSRAKGDKLFKVKQTRNSWRKLDQAKADVEKAIGMARVFNETMKALESKPVTPTEVRNAYLGEAIRNGAKLVRVNAKGESVENKTTMNRIDSLMGLFHRGDGNRGETRADALNGFTQYFTRGGDADSSKSPWAAIGSSEFGGNADRKARFFETAADDKAWGELVSIGAAN
jgi:hypothetical protein